METNLKIDNIRTIYEGEFNPGFLSRKALRRHCDGFIYFVYGDVDYIFEDYSFNANPQNFIFLAKDSIYDINILKKSKFICIDFDFNESSYERKSEVFKINSSTLKSKFTKIFYIWNQKIPWSVPSVFSALYDLYSDAVKSLTKKYAKKSEILLKITSYILSHYCETDFSVKDIVDYSGISETHLRHIFKQNLNMPPIKYINSLKLDKAKNMLQASNYTVNEIASSVGFEDSYYFSRFFKHKTGLSPTEYRKNNKGF